jgi:hypothetical protein
MELKGNLAASDSPTFGGAVPAPNFDVTAVEVISRNAGEGRGCVTANGRVGGAFRVTRDMTFEELSKHSPLWIWQKKTPTNRGGAKLTPESQAAYRAIDLRSTTSGTREARASSRAVGRYTTSSTCSDTRHSIRPAHT